MIESIFYGLTVVVSYTIFLKPTKEAMAEVGDTPGVVGRLTVLVLAAVWPLTFVVAAALVVLGIIRAPGRQPVYVNTSAPRAIAWILSRPEAPVILHDINGRHMMKAADAATKIRGGVSPKSFQVWNDGGWEQMSDQEVAVC